MSSLYGDHWINSLPPRINSLLPTAPWSPYLRFSLKLRGTSNCTNWHRQHRYMRANRMPYLIVSPVRLRSKESGTIKLNYHPFPGILKLSSSCSQMVKCNVSSGTCSLVVCALWHMSTNLFSSPLKMTFPAHCGFLLCFLFDQSFTTYSSSNGIRPNSFYMF